MSDQPQETSLNTVEPEKTTDHWDQRQEHAMEETQAHESARGANNQPMTLLPGEMSGQLRSRWDSIQTGFVDEPRKAVEQADSLVAEAMQKITETFASERTKLQNKWNHGGNASTEDMRLALQQYRSFLNRLTSI